MEFWQQLAERNGPWAVFLLIVLFFLWKWVLPREKEQRESYEATLKEQVAASREALKETTVAARDARREETQLFAEALKRVTDENASAMRQLAAQMEALTNEVRRPRR